MVARPDSDKQPGVVLQYPPGPVQQRILRDEKDSTSKPGSPGRGKHQH
jgi:hypothetical protein